jgi:hypothetical protein
MVMLIEIIDMIKDILQKAWWRLPKPINFTKDSLQTDIVVRMGIIHFIANIIQSAM